MFSSNTDRAIDVHVHLFSRWWTTNSARRTASAHLDFPKNQRNAIKSYNMSDIDRWGPNPGQLELEEGEVHVWRAYLDRTEIVLHQFEATLSADEKARADRFVFRRDRNHFVGTRGILRELLGRYLSHTPAEFEFDYSSKGKPSLRAEFGKRSVQFNISHSHGLALLAFAVGRNLGVDVEFVRSSLASEEIADR